MRKQPSRETAEIIDNDAVLTGDTLSPKVRKCPKIFVGYVT